MDAKKKKELMELLSGCNAEDLQEVAPHVVADISAQAVETFKDEHPATETKTKDKPESKTGTEEKADPKVQELQAKVDKYEAKEKEAEVSKLISAEVEKYPAKFQPMAKNLIEANVKSLKVAGEIKDDKEIVRKATEAADKVFEESKLGVIKVAPGPDKTTSGSATESSHPFAHAGYSGDF